jgi:hypothetical protein
MENPIASMARLAFDGIEINAIIGLPAGLNGDALGSSGQARGES